MTESEHLAGCGRCESGGGGGGRARDPFALPGTERRYSRDRVVDVRHIRLDVAVDLDKRTIRGTATHTVAALNDGTRAVVFDAAEMTIEGVTGPGGKALGFDHVDERLTVRLAAPAAAGEAIDLAIAYQATPRRGLYFTAPDDAYPDRPLQAWTQGQDEDSRYWFPCFDYPNEKATTEMVVTVASRFQTLSNGALIETKPGPAAGTTTWHWRMAIPHVAYLVTLVVGEFDEVALKSKRVPMPVLVPKGRGKDVERCFSRTPAMLEHFSERFGVPYPYEKYAQVVVADFIFGGMENTTATTLTEYALYDARAALDYDADDLIAHELAHQWWGDLLTCRDWSHAWLNEGFATWSESVSREKLLGTDEARWHVVLYARAYFSEDSHDYRRPIVCKTYDEPIDVFDRHLYQKGGCVLNMLRGELGEEAFWRSIQAYAVANRAKSVVTDDLRRAIEETTGRNFEWFFDQWVYGAGHPAIKASWSWDEKAGVAAIQVNQTHPAAELTAEAFRGTLVVEIVTGSERRAVRLDVVRREHTFHVALPARPEGVRFDPEGRWLAAWSIDVGLDEHRKTLASDPSMVVRLRAANALAKDASPETVQTLARALAGDAFWGVRTEAAASLGEIRTPAAREALLAAMPKATLPKVRRAIAAALGAFRGDEPAGDALRELLERGDPSMFVEAEAADALGRTRTPGARDAIEAAMRTRDSWADTVRAGCVRGLGGTASPEALPALERRFEWGNHPRVRGASAIAMAAIGSRLVQRDAIRERLESGVDDRDFRVQMASIFALRALGDEKAIPALRRASDQATDGRVRRACRVAARRLERGGERTTEVARLSDALEALRKQAGEALVRLQRVEAKTGLAPSPAGAPRAARSAGKPSTAAQKKRGKR